MSMYKRVSLGTAKKEKRKKRHVALIQKGGLIYYTRDICGLIERYPPPSPSLGTVHWRTAVYSCLWFGMKMVFFTLTFAGWKCGFLLVVAVKWVNLNASWFNVTIVLIQFVGWTWPIRPDGGNRSLGECDIYYSQLLSSLSTPLLFWDAFFLVLYLLCFLVIPPFFKNQHSEQLPKRLTWTIKVKIPEGYEMLMFKQNGIKSNVKEPL